MKKRIIIYLLLTTSMMIVTACTDTSPTIEPTVDMSEIRGLLPTVSADEIQALAQLADEETLTLGRQVYVAECASCHGIEGEGQFPDAPMQPDETGRLGAPPHNGDGHTWHHDDNLLINYVIEGGQGNPAQFYPMPAFDETLSQEEIKAVIAYIKSLWSEEQRLIQAERTLQIMSQ